MKKIYFHSEGEKTPQIIEVPESITIKELIQKTGLGKDASHKSEEVIICREDGEEFIDIKMTLKEAGIGHKHHIHCHRCKHVEVTISYVSGMKHEFKVAPGLTIGAMIKKAAHQFHIDPPTIPTLILKDDAGNTLDESVHIGSIVHFPKCSVHLVLCPKIIIQG